MTAAAMAVTRRPRYDGYDELGGPNQPGEDYLILVDGRKIGGTYWCGAGHIPDGRRWASWGPAGVVLGQPDRETAERVQVREYACNPDLTDRQVAAEARERQARLDVREAEDQAAEDGMLRERLGGDGPGVRAWVLPPMHYLFGSPGDVAAVRSWLDVHELTDVSGDHEIVVEQRAGRRVLVVSRAPYAPWSAQVQQWAVTLVAEPPAVDTMPRPDLVELLETHRPARFPLIDFGQSWACVACTREFGDRVRVVPWECDVFRAAREEGAETEPPAVWLGGSRFQVGSVATGCRSRRP